MLKRLILAATVAVALAGCGTVATLFTPPGSIPVASTLSPEAQAVQTTINEGNAALTAFNNAVGQQKVDGIITAAKRDAYLDKSDGYGELLDKAQKALRGGDILSAKTSADAVKKLITTLHREAATAARTP